MENTNERFDRMMRGAFSGFGTSASFTRRLMVRIEQEKEIARARRIQRISLIAAVSVFVLALLSLVTCFRPEGSLAGGYWGGLWGRMSDFFSDMLSASRLPSLINTVVVSLAVFAVLSWDAVLKIFYSRQK